MPGIFPNAPIFSPTAWDSKPACEWVMPALLPERACTRTCHALPAGMPDRLEVSVVRFEEGIERSTAVIYGARAYLVHYEFRRNRAPADEAQPAQAARP